MRLKHLLLLTAFALAMPITASAQTYPGAHDGDPSRYDLSSTAFVTFDDKGLLYKFEQTSDGNKATLLSTFGMLYNSKTYPETHPLYQANQYFAKTFVLTDGLLANTLNGNRIIYMLLNIKCVNSSNII